MGNNPTKLEAGAEIEELLNDIIKNVKPTPEVFKTQIAKLHGLVVNNTPTLNRLLSFEEVFNKDQQSNEQNTESIELKVLQAISQMINYNIGYLEMKETFNMVFDIYYALIENQYFLKEFYLNCIEKMVNRLVRILRNVAYIEFVLETSLRFMDKLLDYSPTCEFKVQILCFSHIFYSFYDSDLAPTVEIQQKFLKGLEKIVSIIYSINKSSDILTEEDYDEELRQLILGLIERGLIEKLNNELNKSLDNASLDRVSVNCIELILSIFKYMSQIDFIIWENILSLPDEELPIFERLSIYSSNHEDNDFMPLIIDFYTFYHINALYSPENIYSYMYNTELDSVSVIIRIYNNLHKDKNKAMLSLLIILLSFNVNFWKAIKRHKIQNLPNNCLTNYLLSCLKKKKFEGKAFKLDSDDEEVIDRVMQIYSMLSSKTIIEKIEDYQFLEHIINPILILFYSNFPRLKTRLASIILSFSFISRCKDLILKQVIIPKMLISRIEGFFKSINDVNQVYLENEKVISGIKLLKINLINEEQESKFQDNMDYLNETKSNCCKQFVDYLNIFNLYMSIINNLLMHETTKSSLRVSEKDKEVLYHRTIIYYNYFRDLAGTSEIIRDQGLFKQQTIQIAITLYLIDPLTQFEIVKEKPSFDPIAINTHILFQLLKEFYKSFDVSHKLLFLIRNNLKLRSDINFETILQISLFVVNLIEDTLHPFLTREVIAFLVFSTSISELQLWMIFNSNIASTDNSNKNDILVSSPATYGPDAYKKMQNSLPKRLPYDKIYSCYGKYGVLLFDKFVFTIPKSIDVKQDFSVSIRFFNPLPYSGNFHTLMQSSIGLGGLIVVDKYCSRLGSFTEEGIWIDSGINLKKETLKNRWVNVIMSYSSRLNQTKLNYYLNGKLKKCLLKEKIVFPSTIKYIGNCKDYDEPFGAICDLRVYNHFVNDMKAHEIYSSLKFKDFGSIKVYCMITSSQLMREIITKFKINPKAAPNIIVFQAQLLNNCIQMKLNKKKIMQYKIIMDVVETISHSKHKLLLKELCKFIISLA